MWITCTLNVLHKSVFRIWFSLRLALDGIWKLYYIMKPHNGVTSTYLLPPHQSQSKIILRHLKIRFCWYIDCGFIRINNYSINFQKLKLAEATFLLKCHPEYRGPQETLRSPGERQCGAGRDPAHAEPIRKRQQKQTKPTFSWCVWTPWINSCAIL